MSHAPVMPLFPDALLGGTVGLSTEQFGAYCLILFATWANNGKPLPDDDAVLARTCRTNRSKWRQNIRPALIGFFDVRDGALHQKRLEKEWEFVQALRETRREIGSRGGQATAARKLQKNTPPKRNLGGAAIFEANQSNTLNSKEPQSPIGAPIAAPIGAPKLKQPKPKPKKERGESLVINTQSPRAHTRAREEPVPDIDTRPSPKKLKNEGKEEARRPLAEIPDGWLEEAEAARDDAGLEAVNLPLEWAKFAARADGEIELRRWIEWALRAWVQREPRHANGSNGSPAAETVPEIPWANRMRAWRDGGFWMPNFGPKPGESGCFVPARYLEAAE